jgi:hypothetical protein
LVFVPVKRYIKNMMHAGKTLVCLMGVWAVCRMANGAAAQSATSPYQGIVERNIFGLKPPPPPPDPEANKPPPPKIILQGFTTFGGAKRALLKAQMPAKPGEPPKGEQSFILAEGQRDGDIEVLEIDAVGGTVKVSNFGTITNLSFENNGIKTAGAAPGPGPAPNPAGFVPKPGANPFAPAGGSLPMARPIRPTGAYGGSAAPSTYTAVPTATSYGSAPGTVTLPGFTTSTTPIQTAAQQQQPPMSEEAQTALMAAQHLANQGKVFPPTPPPIANMLGEGDNSAPATTPPRPGSSQPPRPRFLPPLPPMPQ